MKAKLLLILFLFVSCNGIVSQKAPPDDDNTISREESCENCDKDFNLKSSEDLCNELDDYIWLSGQCDSISSHSDAIPELEAQEQLTYEEELRVKKAYLNARLYNIKRSVFKSRNLEKIEIKNGVESQVKNNKLILNIGNLPSKELLADMLKD